MSEQVKTCGTCEEFVKTGYFCYETEYRTLTADGVCKAGEEPVREERECCTHYKERTDSIEELVGDMFHYLNAYNEELNAQTVEGVEHRNFLLCTLRDRLRALGVDVGNESKNG